MNSSSSTRELINQKFAKLKKSKTGLTAVRVRGRKEGKRLHQETAINSYILKSKKSVGSWNI